MLSTTLMTLSADMSSLRDFFGLQRWTSVKIAKAFKKFKNLSNISRVAFNSLKSLVAVLARSQRNAEYIQV